MKFNVITVWVLNQLNIVNTKYSLNGIAKYAWKACTKYKQAEISSKKISNSEIKPIERGYWLSKENIRQEFHFYLKATKKSNVPLTIQKS